MDKDVVAAFVEKYFNRGGEQSVMAADLAALLADELVFGVEWGIKHASQESDWPLSWKAGFPSMKVQALIDRAAAIRADKVTP